jgi:hypothetical protein
MGYIDPIEALDSPFRGRWNWQKTWLGVEVDAGRVARAALATREAGVWNCPTLTVYRRLALTGDEAAELLAQPEMRLLFPQRRSEWESCLNDWSQRLREEEEGVIGQGEIVRAQLVRALRDAGAGLLAGTDAPHPLVLPGYALHEELAQLAAAGLTPYEALRTATVDAARFLGAGEEFGTIAPGQRADLLLLAGNPLEDIQATRRIEGVMARGRWLAIGDLRERAARTIAEGAGAPDR